VIPNYSMNSKLLEELTEIKDLGVYCDPLLLFDKHICEKVKIYMMLKYSINTAVVHTLTMLCILFYLQHFQRDLLRFINH